MNVNCPGLTVRPGPVIVQGRLQPRRTRCASFRHAPSGNDRASGLFGGQCQQFSEEPEKLAHRVRRGGLFIETATFIGAPNPVGVTCRWGKPSSAPRWRTGHPYGVWDLGWAGVAINRPPLTGFQCNGRARACNSAQPAAFQIWAMAAVGNLRYCPTPPRRSGTERPTS